MCIFYHHVSSVHKPGSNILLQFFQVAVINIVACPLGHSIELYAVRELHGLALKELPVFAFGLASSSCLLLSFSICRS